jgi:uncharacterized protein
LCREHGGFVALRLLRNWHSFAGNQEFGMTRFVFGIVSGVWLMSGSAWSQAFNCDFAKLPDEITICRDASLGALDEQMSDHFYKIRQQLPPAGMKALNAGQKNFLSRRNFCGTDGDCIAGMYAERIETLCTLATDYGVECPQPAQ